MEMTYPLMVSLSDRSIRRKGELDTGQGFSVCARTADTRAVREIIVSFMVDVRT